MRPVERDLQRICRGHSTQGKRKGKEKGTFYFFGADRSLRGRPRGRSVLCKPSRRAAIRAQFVLPKGAPRTTLVRSVASSASFCGRLTSVRQSRGNVTGLAASHAGGSRPCRAARLLY